MTAEPTTRPAREDWPRQLRLPGQAAAPEGPVDMIMMYLMHHAFRRDLAAFAAAVPHTPVEDTGAWGALAARWALLRRHAAPPPRRRGRLAVAGAARAGRRRGAGDAARHGGRARGDRPAARGLATGFARMAAGAGADCSGGTRRAPGRGAREPGAGTSPTRRRRRCRSSRRTSCRPTGTAGQEVPGGHHLRPGGRPGAVGASEVPAAALPDLFARRAAAAPAHLAVDPSPVRAARGAGVPPRHLSQKPARSRWPRSHCPASGTSHSAHSRSPSSACRVARSPSPAAAAAMRQERIHRTGGVAGAGHAAHPGVRREQGVGARPEVRVAHVEGRLRGVAPRQQREPVVRLEVERVARVVVPGLLLLAAAPQVGDDGRGDRQRPAPRARSSARRSPRSCPARCSARSSRRRWRPRTAQERSGRPAAGCWRSGPRTPRTGRPSRATGAPGCRAPSGRRACRSRSASARATSTAAHMSCGRPSSPRTTARSVPDTTTARSLPVPRRERDGLVDEGEPLRSACPATTATRTPIWQASSSSSSSPSRRAIASASSTRARRSSKRRAVVELVGQAEQHPAAQRAVLGAAAGRGWSAAPAPRPRAPRRAGPTATARPGVVEIAARGDERRVADLLRHPHRQLDRRGQLRPHRRPPVGVDQLAAARRSGRAPWRRGRRPSRRAPPAAGRRPPRGRELAGTSAAAPPRPARHGRRTSGRRRASAARPRSRDRGGRRRTSATRACSRARRDGAERRD